MAKKPRVASAQQDDDHPLDAPEMKARLESVRKMAFDHAIAAGRDSDSADTIGAKAMRQAAKRLEMDRDYLADDGDRERYAKCVGAGVVISEWEYADVRQRGESMVREQQEHYRSSHFDPAAVFDKEEIKWQKKQATLAINVLSPRRRELMVDHHINERPSKELADASGTTDGSVRVILHDALSEIRERLGQTAGAKNRRRKKP